ECTDGYFILAESAGISSVQSLLLSAYHTKSKIKINSSSGKTWRGWPASTKLCEIEALGFVDY
ncbi:MAG: hypothetical protein MJK04_28785, partial [Psychrosphaera sp.]|nr:hypothetical protein [Psychrosphaera sp.]